MDKLLKTNWFVMLISFVLALMLYTIVAVPKNIQQNAGSIGNESAQERIEDVEVQVYYDDANYVVSGIPETVDVTLTGSPTKLFLAKIEKNLEVYVDLNDFSLGTHTVSFQYRGVSDDIDVAIYPAQAKVTIEKRVSKNFPIEIELINRENSLPEGYSVGDPIVTPSTVTVHGSEKQLNQIRAIKGTIDLDGQKETFVTSVPIKAYDEENNEIKGLFLNPNVVDVEVPIISPHKDVPIKINQINSLPEGKTIELITTKPETVTIYGEKDVIKEINFVEATVDLKNLADKNTETVTVDVKLPKGVKTVEPKQIEVTIKLGKEVTKTIKKVPIQVTGLREGLSFTFVDPKEGTIDVVISGAQSILDKTTLKDIQAIIDASNLEKGEHKVAVTFNGPQNVSWQQKQTIIKIY